jgi:hypothetical protein
MENQDMLDSGFNNSENGNGLNSEDKYNLTQAGKWARFLGIVGYVFTGFIAIAALFLMVGMGAMGDAMGLGGGIGAMAGILYIGLAVLYFFISKHTYNFGKGMRQSIEQNISGSLTSGFKSLNSLFTITGILTAIVVGLYAIILLFALLGGGLAALAN